ncbi:MAG: cell division protein FtsA [Fimbriimonadales bacterium]
MDSQNIIDLGSTKTVCIIADFQETGNPRVVGVGVSENRGVKRGTIVDLDATAQSVVSAIRKAETMSDRKVTSVITSVSGDHITGATGKGIIPIVPPGRAISREDVNRVINHSKQVGLPPDRELIHAVPGHYRVDGQDGVVRPIGMSAERLEVSTHLVSGHSAHIQTLERCFDRAQVEIEGLVISQLASCMSVLDNRESEAGVAVLDIGGTHTEIAVMSGGALLHTAIIPIGSTHISSDVSQLLKVSHEEAERLKLTYGGCDVESVTDKETFQVAQVGVDKPRPFSRKVFTEIIDARCRELFTLARRNISEKSLLPALGSGYVLTGGGSKLPGLSQLLATMSGDAAVRVGKPAPLAGLGDMVSGEEFATAVGLVRYGMRAHEDEAVSAEEGNTKGIFSKLGSWLGAKNK